jgi:hypothetical protein
MDVVADGVVMVFVFSVQAPRGGGGVCLRGNFQTTTPPRLAWILSTGGGRLKDRIARCLALIDGPGWEGREGRGRAVAPTAAGRSRPSADGVRPTPA